MPKSVATTNSEVEKMLEEIRKDEQRFIYNNTQRMKKRKRRNRNFARRMKWRK